MPTKKDSLVLIRSKQMLKSEMERAIDVLEKEILAAEATVKKKTRNPKVISEPIDIPVEDKYKDKDWCDSFQNSEEEQILDEIHKKFWFRQSPDEKPMWSIRKLRSKRMKEDDNQDEVKKAVHEVLVDVVEKAKKTRKKSEKP